MNLRYSSLSSIEKYTYFSRKHVARRPIHFRPKYTKIENSLNIPYGQES